MSKYSPMEIMIGESIEFPEKLKENIEIFANKNVWEEDDLLLWESILNTHEEYEVSTAKMYGHLPKDKRNRLIQKALGICNEARRQQLEDKNC